MQETTSALLQQLCNTESGQGLLRRKQEEPTCAQTVQAMLERAGLSAQEWMTSADISKSYGYQILRGERVPGRDILLHTALVLALPLKETQRLLAIGGCGALYLRGRRDAAVIFALHQRMTLLEAEELLTSLPERGIYAGEC